MLSVDSQLADVDIDATNHPKLDGLMMERMRDSTCHSTAFVFIQELTVRNLFQESTGMSVNRPKFKTIGELGKIFDGKPIEFSALLNRIELTVENRYSST